MQVIHDEQYFNTELTAVNLSGVVQIGCYAFADCRFLRDVAATDLVTHVGDNAFQRCVSLRAITLPSINSLPERVFSECYNLRDVKLNANISQFGKYAFEKCYNLCDIDTSHVSRIEMGCFRECHNIRYLDMSNAEYIGKYAFAWCDNLREIKFSSKLREIDEEAFLGCNALDRVIVPDTCIIKPQHLKDKLT